MEIAERFVAAGDRVGGWKVGMTSGGSRDMMGNGFRPHGYVLERRLFRSGDEISLGRMLNCGIEPELCLVLGSELQGPATIKQARTAVRAVAPAFELNEVRVPGGRDADHATLIADGIGNWGIVVGPEAPPDRLLPDIAVTLFRDGEQVAHATAEEVSMDDPFLSLSRLANSLAERGRGLQPGQAVITGSFAQLRVEGPGVWRAEFEEVGEVSIKFG